MYGEEHSKFVIRSGVRQGCSLPPVLFNYAMNWTMSKTVMGYPGVQPSQSAYITDLQCEDDTVVPGDSPAVM